MRVITLLLAILPINFSLAQNLVPNASFEEINSLPCDVYVNDLSEAKKMFNAILKYWKLPTDATTDPFSLLSGITCQSYPSQEIWGAPLPKDGNNMVGLYTTSLTNRNYREYISVRLKDKLIPGQQYLCGFYTAISSKFNFSSNEIGMYFSPDTVTHPYRDIFVFSLNYNPQVRFDLTDNSKKWRLYTGCFTAEQELAYLTIGNFRDKNYDDAYNFIDSVFVQQINKPFIPNVITPNGDCCNEKFVLKDVDAADWSVTILNRWGQSVHQSESYKNNFTGSELSTGVYFYHVQHRECKNLTYKGSLTIIH